MLSSFWVATRKTSQHFFFEGTNNGTMEPRVESVKTCENDETRGAALLFAAHVTRSICMATGRPGFARKRDETGRKRDGLGCQTSMETTKKDEFDPTAIFSLRGV